MFLRCCLLIFLIIAFIKPVYSEATLEYKIKAALIFKLSRFIQWPASALKNKNQPFNLCILGQDPFNEAIDALTTRKTQGHPIVIHRFYIYHKQNCQMLFISTSERLLYHSVLEKIKTQPILTLSDITNFAKENGMIEINKKGKRFGFSINLKKAKKADLKISATLLQMATIIP